MSRFKAIMIMMGDLWVILCSMILVSYAIAAVSRGEGVWPWPALAGVLGILGMAVILVTYGKAWKAYRREVRRSKSTV